MTEYDGHVWVCFDDGLQTKDDTTPLKVAKVKLVE
jgi:hypothetical protein